MPCGKRVPQVMPPEILNPGTLQRIAPSFGIHLDDWISLVGENVARVPAHSHKASRTQLQSGGGGRHPGLPAVGRRTAKTTMAANDSAAAVANARPGAKAHKAPATSEAGRYSNPVTKL